MGRRHFEAVKGLGHSVVGIFDINKQTMDSAQNDGLVLAKECFDNVEKMLQETKPEAVVIATTATSHAQYSILASKMGVKYILCEKPMACSLAECDEIISVCEKNQTTFAVNHQMRFIDGYVEVKNLLQQEDFGPLRSITVVGANFGLAMNASHYFEMFRYMTNEEVATISFWKDDTQLTNPRGPQYVDMAGQIRAESATGVRLYVELGGDLGHGVQTTFSCRNGQIQLDELAGKIRGILREDQYLDLPTSRYGMPAKEIIKNVPGVPIVASTQKVLTAMFNQENYPDMQCGRHAVMGLLACYSSADKNSLPIHLQQLQNSNTYSWA